ncbi:MAG: hypothetical protein R3Y05_01535 [bacterium]
MIKYSVYSDFDLDKHKETFTNYCEVVILEDGTVKYAVPSHEQMLIKLYADKKGMSVEEFYNWWDENKHIDFRELALKEVKCVLVWTNFCQYIELNKVQNKVLKSFIGKGIVSKDFKHYKLRSVKR